MTQERVEVDFSDLDSEFIPATKHKPHGIFQRRMLPIYVVLVDSAYWPGK
jgi:hypothetical protein